MPLALSIAIRFLLGGRNRYARFIAWVSLAGLGLGVLVLTVVVSVMNGFGAELRTRILGTIPHVLASPGDPALLELPGAGEGVRHAYRLFRASGMATQNGAMAPVAIFAIDPEGARSLPQIGDNMISGDLQAALTQPGGAVLGWSLAYHLGLVPGDELLLIVSQPVDGVVYPRFKRFRLAATFEMGADFDHSLILVPRSAFSEQERRFMGTDGARLDLENPDHAEQFAASLRSRFPHLQVETWMQTQGALFQAVKIEKALMFLILLLVVAVAGFNIVSGQSMLADDKRAEIAILRTMGAGDGLVLRVFLLQGVAIATVGILAGLVLGALAAANIGDLAAALESWLGFSLLEGSYFFVLPSLVLPRDLAVIGGLSWLLCLLTAWLPARRAVRQNPVAGLH